MGLVSVRDGAQHQKRYQKIKLKRQPSLWVGAKLIFILGLHLPQQIVAGEKTWPCLWSSQRGERGVYPEEFISCLPRYLDRLVQERPQSI